jgi:hypothetical protein
MGQVASLPVPDATPFPTIYFKNAARFFVAAAHVYSGSELLLTITCDRKLSVVKAVGNQRLVEFVLVSGRI